MSAATLFWAGAGLFAVGVGGLAIAICRAGALADEDLQRALRQERAARAGVAIHTGNVQPSPQQPPYGADAPRATPISSQSRGATTSRKRGAA